MKKSGRNVFLIALLISATVHVFAYCSVTAYIGWRKKLSYQGGDDSIPLMEIGLIAVSALSAPLRSEPPRREEGVGVTAVRAPSEIKLAGIVPEVLPETERENSPDDRLQHPETDKAALPAPEGLAGVSPVSGGLPMDEYLQEVRRRIESAIYYPRRARLSRLEGVVKVSFAIDQEGTLLHPRVIEASPHMIFNRTALEILGKAAPFPKAGPEIAGKAIAVSISFESTY